MTRRPVPAALRRAAPAAAAGLAAFACCLAGSLFQHARLVARVDGISVWRAMHRRWHLVLASWQTSVTAADWLLFGGVSAFAAGLVVARPILRRFAAARRGTE